MVLFSERVAERSGNGNYHTASALPWRYGSTRRRFDNLNNELVQGNHIVPVVRKFGHPFMLLHRLEEIMAFNQLTEPQLRQLHRRFGHPSVRRLAKILSRAVLV